MAAQVRARREGKGAGGVDAGSQRAAQQGQPKTCFRGEALRRASSLGYATAVSRRTTFTRAATSKGLLIQPDAPISSARFPASSAAVTTTIGVPDLEPASKLGGEFPPVHDGHLHVQEDEIRHLLLDRTKGLHAIGRRIRLEALRLEDEGDQLQEVGIVIYHQDRLAIDSWQSLSSRMGRQLSRVRFSHLY